MSLGNEAIGKLVFVDSFRFQADSLDELINTQLKFGSPEKSFPITAEHHPWSHKLPLILQKIPFPYGALAAPPDTWSDMPGVLPQEYYDNELRKTKCSDEQYGALQVLSRS